MFSTPGNDGGGSPQSANTVGFSGQFAGLSAEEEEEQKTKQRRMRFYRNAIEQGRMG
jgi:hypothetical protein